MVGGDLAVALPSCREVIAAGQQGLCLVSYDMLLDETSWISHEG
jgi:hypothetical protein